MFFPPKLGFLVNSGQCLGTCYLQIESLDDLCVACWSPRLLTRLRLDDPGICPSPAQASHVWVQPYLLAQSCEVGTRCIIPALHLAHVDTPLYNFDLYLKQRQLHREEPVALAKWEGVHLSMPAPSLELVDWILCCYAEFPFLSGAVLVKA